MSRTGKILLYLTAVLQCVTLLLAGCGQSGAKTPEPAADTAQPSSEQREGPQGTSETDSFGNETLSKEEASLLTVLKEASGENVLLFDCADFDGDGVREAFGFTGTEADGILEGRRWFISSAGAELMTEAGDTEYLRKGSSVVKMPDGTSLWYTEADGMSDSSSILWGMSDGRPEENILSGKGQDFSPQEDGTFLLYQSSLDAFTDGTGRTLKPCFFYYEDGSFHEYGAVCVNWEDFLLLPGAEECVAPYVNDNYWEQGIWLRGNGLLQVNLRSRERNCTLTCVWKAGALTVKTENDGVAGTLIGELAAEKWEGPEGELQKLWEEGLAAEKMNGIFHFIPSGQISWYDLDGDGQLEEIAYTVSMDVDAWYADSVSIRIDREEIWSRDENDSSNYRMWVTDLVAGDGKKELVLQARGDNDWFSMLKFFRWEDHSLRELGDLCQTPVLNGTGNLYRINGGEYGYGSLMRLPGDGTVTLWADTPVFAPGLGSYYVELSLSLEKNGFTFITQPEYKIKASAPGGQPYPYTAQQPIAFYESPEAYENDVSSFTVNSGEQMNCISLIPDTENQVFAKMRRLDTGEEGWTLFSDTPLFVEPPAQG